MKPITVKHLLKMFSYFYFTVVLYICICIYCTYICMYLYFYTCNYIQIYTCAYIFACINIYIYIYISVGIFILELYLLFEQSSCFYSIWRTGELYIKFAGNWLYISRKPKNIFTLILAYFYSYVQ